MKKLFLLLPAVMAVFALVFTSCEAAVNPDVVTAGYTKIEDPVVKATTFPGAILVSWLPVKDAQSYVVTRRDDTTGQIKKSTGGGFWNGANADNGGDDYFYVLDVTSVSDELVNGRSYTYSVIATNVLGIDGNGGTLAADIDPILNGKTEATVSARVPADYAVPAITDVKTTQIVDASDGSDWVKITWKAGDYNPAVKSTVTYSYGAAQDLGTAPAGVFKITVGGAGVNGAGQKGEYTALVPVIGGDNAITISNTFGDGLYYAAGADATKTVTHTGSKSNLGNITGFQAGSPAAGNTIPVDGKPAVPLQYTGLNTRGNFDAGAVEKLYRAEIVGKTGVNNSFVTGNTVTNWTAVDLVWTTQSANLRTALDTTVVEGTSYAYTLVLDKAGVKSNPSTANAAAGTVSTVTLPKIDFTGGGGVAQYSTEDATGIINGVALRITWIGEQGASYRLYRAPNIGTNAAPWPGTWTEVTAAALTASVADDKIIVNDTNAAKRTEWYYRVIATKGTLTKNVAMVSATPYNVAPWNATGAYNQVWGITKPSATEIRFAPEGTVAASTEIFPGESLVVYYRPSDVQAQYAASLSVSYTELTAAGAGTVIANPKTATLDEHRTYYYRRYIKTAGENGVLLAIDNVDQAL